MSCAVAWVQDGAALPLTPGAGAPSRTTPALIGPYGALVWGAYLLGKGVKVTVQVELFGSGLGAFPWVHGIGPPVP